MRALYYILLAGILFLTSCSNASQPNDPIPEHETFTIQSKQVGEERTINVWTPEEYKSNTDSIMVLYMPDGGIKEDFPHIANTLNDLIKANKIPAVILVGIENTQRRKDLTGPTTVGKDKEIAPVVGGSGQFRAFIDDELIPKINKRYRTTNKKGIIGESLAGLFVTETFLLKPEMFDFYIAFDPSLWWNDEYLVKTANEHLDKFPDAQKTFWFAGSGATDISVTVGKLSDILKTKNSENIKWEYSDEKKEKHNTIFRATKEKAITWTLNNI
ncbi:alpha/beta hydrolase [Sphingobacterium hungaricum]|uniref:Esterase n=1 Tax=Sphingobacterium hungaricum TaxID=2082723 RepID=A0A928YRQ0_9SPHI|nr:alpha/beta hydrolase-fold protein [Sphingobacterium hungaricum]MBE8715541.1 esterase [Sphingobacterium hungaricum]